MDLFVPRLLSIAGALPTVAVLVTGMVLAAQRRDGLPARARALLTSGTAVLLVVALVTLTWNLGFSHLATSDWIRDGGYQRLSLLIMAVNGLIAIGHPIGFGLLIGAVLAGRRPAEPPVGPWGSWTGPAAAPPPATAANGAGAAAETGGWIAPDPPPAAPGHG